MIKILTNNAVENTNINGAAFNRFTAGNRDGYVVNVLNSGAMVHTTNTITLSSGELLICGHQIWIEDSKDWTFNNLPSNPINYQIIAQIVVSDSGVVEFSFVVQETQDLVQDELFKTASGNGTYQVEIARFVLGSDGISEFKRTVKSIVGGSSGGDRIHVGTIETVELSPDSEPYVYITERYEPDDKIWYTDFRFGIPQGQQGLQGETGTIGLVHNDVYNVMFDNPPQRLKAYTDHVNNFNRTPAVGDAFYLVIKDNAMSTNSWLCSARIIDIADTMATFEILQVAYTKGERGQQGLQGETGTIGLVHNDVYNVMFDNPPQRLKAYTDHVNNFNRTPAVGDAFYLVIKDNAMSTNSWLCSARIIDIADTMATFEILQVAYTKGERGPQGLSYVETVSESVTIAESDWVEDLDIEPFVVKATKSTTLQLNPTSVVSGVFNTLDMARYGIAIGNITDSQITYFATQKPEQSITGINIVEG